jgi:hypothetical protein
MRMQFAQVQVVATINTPALSALGQNSVAVAPE